jgi:hypothetical protein
MPGLCQNPRTAQTCSYSLQTSSLSPECHPWMGGLVMDLVMYVLLKPTAPFVGVNNPGDFPVYANFATEAAIKMTDKQFERD